MENVFKLLRVAFYVIVFFIAIALLYAMFYRFDSLVDKSADYVVGDNQMYESNPNETEHYITRADLITLLLNKLEYDIQIIDESGTYNIVSDGYSPDNIGLYNLISNNFRKTYSYRLNGEITKILFQYVNE